MDEDVEPGSVGQSFDDFLIEQGLFEDTTKHAQLKVCASHLDQEREKQGISRSQLAELTGMNAEQIDNVFDRSSREIDMDELAKVATALGYMLRITIAPIKRDKTDS